MPCEDSTPGRRQPVRRLDYRPPAFLIDRVDLEFDLAEDATEVASTLHLRRNPQADRDVLVLDGEGLELLDVRLDGVELGADAFDYDGSRLRIEGVADTARLFTRVRIHPESNTALEGLYRSSGSFCTQCEPEGFRKITFFADRPDVLASFTTRITADRERYPVLLSNGNPGGAGLLADGRHWARWHDPFPKPSYLFALVAGRLERVSARYTTMSGRDVDLHLYVEARNIDKCEHALASLERAMRWDEDVYGREYDLDVYMVVAVDDFNMGAMENKGLNIFNSKYVLARPETATDADYRYIEGVIGHEYFHNWTGNRVTCRDWFQLSLKEGLTVFRDQEFSGDMGSRAVKRIEDVEVLRSYQFPEDAGPMAHPVRPDSYLEINNFYTATVYNKGAEVIRMMHRLLGAEAFRHGMDLYFERFDGQAVTCDDFVQAMEDASGVDLGQFRRWYSQAGTPLLRVRRQWFAEEGALELEITQELAPVADQEAAGPMHIPLALALVGPDGRDRPLRLDGEECAPQTPTRVFELRQVTERLRFVGLDREPVPSLLRGFCAPVRLATDLSRDELAFLAAHDADPFNRWDAGQRLALDVLLGLVEDVRQGRPLELPGELAQAWRATLEADDFDAALLAKALVLPGEAFLADQMDEVDVDAVHRARTFVRRELARVLAELWRRIVGDNAPEKPCRLDARTMGRRALRNVSLAYLVRAGERPDPAPALDQLRAADNMTDEVAALAVLANLDVPQRDAALAEFAARWQTDPLVMDKWLGIQAMSELPDTLAAVVGLLDHPVYDARNPNKVRALVGVFCGSNQVRFHAADGAGYRFLADQVLALDPLNPQVAARMVGHFSRWRRFDERRRELMQVQLERIVAVEGLSRDVYEIAAKSLGHARS